MDFMAVEVTARNYLFSGTTKVAADYIGEKTSSEYSFCRSEQGSEHLKQFWANYVHDLESIWWIAVWTFYLFKKKDTEEGPTEDSKSVFEGLFSNPNALYYRYNFLSSRDIFEISMKDVTYKIPELEKIILKIRRKLLATYALKEMGMDKTSPILMDDKCEIHEDILQILRSARATGKGDVVLASGKSIEEQMSIWELGPTLMDISETGDESIVEYEPNVKNATVINKTTDSILTCEDKKMGKSKAKCGLQDVNASLLIPAKKGRLASLEGNTRVTRSMTRLKLRNAISYGEDRKDILKRHRKKKKTRQN